MRRFLLLPAAVALLPAGCTTVQVPPLEPLGKERAVLEPVRYIPQQESEDCAAACLTTVLRYHGSDLTLDDVDAGLKRVRDGGVIPAEIIYFARKQGYRVTLYGGGLNDLRRKVLAGKPLVLLVHDSPRPTRLLARRPGHYLVAVGFDDRDAEAVVHTGDRAFGRLSYATLHVRWKRSGFLTLLVER
ncbi:MAG: C39 family peptidase [Planctomycetota bacterium]